MQIGKDKVVSFHYIVSEVDGAELESSHGSSPLVYLHGHNGMIKGIEAALEGKSVGDKIKVTLSPEEAYGERRDDAIQRVSVNHILRDNKKAKPKFRPGQIVHLNTEHGAMPAVVIKAGLKMVDVDTNHPYAGKTLTYDMEVVNVRDAQPEELEHGHVHGDGGVHH